MHDSVPSASYSNVCNADSMILHFIAIPYFCTVPHHLDEDNQLFHHIRKTERCSRLLENIKYSYSLHHRLKIVTYIHVCAIDTHCR